MSRDEPAIGFNFELTDEQLAELERRFLAAWDDPKERRRANRQTLRMNLPRRTRLRLAAQHLYNAAGIWLVDHGHFKAVARLWRITGRW